MMTEDSSQDGELHYSGTSPDCFLKLFLPNKGKPMFLLTPDPDRQMCPPVLGFWLSFTPE